jgi:hypothetical protein
MFVQDLAVAQTVKKFRVANSTRSVITKVSANFQHHSILSNTSLNIADYETIPSSIPRFDLRVLYTLKIQSFPTEEMPVSSFHNLWAQ